MNILSWLTGFRGLIALIVVAYHLNQYFPTSELTSLWTDMSHLVLRLSVVVSVFFFFSGFFRAFSYWKTLDTPEKTPKFWISFVQRWKRIVPLYYLILCLSIIVTWMIEGLGHIDWISFFVGFTFFSWISADTLFPVLLNWPLWFVAFDMMGWILTSLVMMGYVRFVGKGIFSQRSIIYFAVITGIMLTLNHLWTSIPWTQSANFPANIWFPYYNPFLFLLHFLFGIVSAGIVFSLQKKIKTPHMIADIWVVIILTFAGYLLWDIRHEWDDFAFSLIRGPYYFPWAQGIIAMLVILLPFTKLIWKILDNRVLYLAAGISYSLFLIHMLVIRLLLEYVFGGSISTIGEWIWLGVSTYIISIFSAYILHRTIEK